MDYREKIDYSSLSTYMECPRKFLFKYMMHFRSLNKNINLIFGSCWHYGLEQVYKEQITNDSLSIIDATDLSILSFNKLWEIEGSKAFPDSDIIFPKSPGHAANVYHKYWKRFLKLDQKDKKVLTVEEPFLIDLSIYQKNLPAYIGRIDLIFSELKGNISIVDHKSAKALYPITLTSYESSFQTDGYLTAGHMFYDKIPSMIYSIALFQKSEIDFHRYYINKRTSSLDQFLNDLIYYLNDLLHNIDLMEKDLSKDLKRNDSISSFHRCPGIACTTFMSPCQYFQICKIRNNPLLWYNNPPQGFEVNEWDPDLHDVEMREKLGEI